MTREEFKARVSMSYGGRETWEEFLEAVWQLHLEASNNWIPVEERKPQERGHYLVYSQFGDVWLSEWMQDKEGRWDWYVAPICVGIISKVTHWMPLPEAPRKEENNE